MKKEVLFLAAIILLILPLTSSYKFCNNTIDPSQLEIRAITDSEQTSDDTWTWSQIKTITVAVEITNKNLTKRDFSVELYLLEEGEYGIINFTESKTIPTTTINIDKPTTKTATLSFKLRNVKNIPYHLYAKVTDKNNASICTSQMATEDNHETNIQIEQENRIVAIEQIDGPINLTPDSTASFQIKIINLGNRDENKVSVIIYNANLGIRKTTEIESLHIEETKSATITFQIPKNISTPTTETLLFDTEFDYDTEKNLYLESSMKPKSLEIKINPTSPQTQAETPIQETTQAQNQSSTTENSSSSTTSIQEKTMSTIKENYKLISIIIGAIALILIALILVTSHIKKRKQIPELEKSKTQIQEYLASIKKSPTTTPQKIIPPQPKPNSPPTSNSTIKILTPKLTATQTIKPQSPNLPSKPSETNTARTASQPTSQNQPLPPSSPPRPAVTPSSPQSTPAKSAAPSPVTGQKPQTNPPSPPAPTPNKPSAPQPSQDSTQTAPTRKANKAPTATRGQPSSPSPSSNQTK